LDDAAVRGCTRIQRARLLGPARQPRPDPPHPGTAPRKGAPGRLRRLRRFRAGRPHGENGRASRGVRGRPP
jgi:hypothetical protein